MILGMVAMSVEQFEELVAMLSMEYLPSLARAMENVAVVVDDHSPPGRPLGLYQGGVPLTSCGLTTRQPLRIASRSSWPRSARRARRRKEVVEVVRRVVIHEVGHHFGIDDKRFEELGVRGEPFRRPTPPGHSSVVSQPRNI